MMDPNKSQPAQPDLPPTPILPALHSPLGDAGIILYILSKKRISRLTVRNWIKCPETGLGSTGSPTAVEHWRFGVRKPD